MGDTPDTTIRGERMSILVKVLRPIFTLCLILMFILGVIIVIGQTIAIITLNGTLATDTFKILGPYATIFASLTGLIGYILSYVEPKKKKSSSS